MESETGELKTAIQKLFLDSLKQHDPATIVIDYLQKNKNFFDGFKNIEVVAIGKSANGMAGGASNWFGNKVKRGLIICNTTPENIPERFSFLLSSHPLPDQKSLMAGKNLIKFCQATSTDSLLLFLVSGGTSAMVAVPAEGISLKLKNSVTHLLLRNGVAIEELNLVRKALSEIKGGKLLSHIKSKKIVNLLISDVPGNDICIIGSGLLVPEKIQRKKITAILEKFGVDDNFGVISKVNKLLPAKLKEGRFSAGQELIHEIIDSNDRFLATIRTLAEQRGFATALTTHPIFGNVDFASAKLLIEFEISAGTHSVMREKPFLLISGGETTSKVLGSGKGGRNCEMVMRFSRLIAGKRYIQLSVGTDGVDGNSDLAGGIVDGFTFEQSLENGIDFEESLTSSDSGGWLRSCRASIETGPTGINLADLYLLCRY